MTGKHNDKNEAFEIVVLLIALLAIAILISFGTIDLSKIKSSMDFLGLHGR